MQVGSRPSELVLPLLAIMRLGGHEWNRTWKRI